MASGADSRQTSETDQVHYSLLLAIPIKMRVQPILLAISAQDNGQLSCPQTTVSPAVRRTTMAPATCSLPKSRCTGS